MDEGFVFLLQVFLFWFGTFIILHGRDRGKPICGHEEGKEKDEKKVRRQTENFTIINFLSIVYEVNRNIISRGRNRISLLY